MIPPKNQSAIYAPVLYRAEHERLAGILKRMRERAGLSQRQLAAKLTKPQSAVAKIELGSQYVRFVDVLAWSDACGGDALDALKDAVAK